MLREFQHPWLMHGDRPANHRANNGGPMNIAQSGSALASKRAYKIGQCGGLSHEQGSLHII